MAHRARRPQATVRSHALVRATALALSTLTLSLLGACGGGDDDPSTSAEVTPAGVVNTVSAGNLPLRRNLTSEQGQFTAQQLLLIDASSGSAVWRREVSTDSTQAAVRAFSVSADGLTVTQGAYTQWFFTDGGKLYVQDLTSPSSAARQVSSEASVCDIPRVEPQDAAATTSWLLLRTGGTDGRCDTPDDNTTKLVRSDAASTTAALAWAGGTLLPLGVHRDAAGALTQLVAFDATAHQVIVVAASNGQATPASEVLASDASVAWVGRAAGRRDQVMLAVQAAGAVTLRPLTWSGDQAAPTLGGSVMSLSRLVPAYAHTDDARGLYLVDDGSVYVLPKGGAAARTLATLPTIALAGGTLSAPVYEGSAMTASTLVLSSLALDGAKVYVVNKDDGAVRSLNLQAEGELPYTVEAHRLDQIVLSRPLDVGGPLRALWRADVSGSASSISVTAVASQAHVIASPRTDDESLGGETQQVATVWCAAQTACTAATVQSLQLLTGSTLNLAAAGVNGVVWADHAAGATVGSHLGVSASSQVAVDVWASDSVWILDALQAGSLKQVLVSP